MPTLQFTLNDYISYVLTSHKRKLLVEGSDDNRLFNRLVDVFDKQRKLVDIDNASQLIGFDQPIGNREKVELVCSTIEGTKFSEKLVGFVDREYRGFNWNLELQDQIQAHYVSGRLVWTRGHSIENYYFDFNTLRDPISTLSTTIYYQSALRLFEKIFEKAVRLACVASLLSVEIGNYQIIKSAMTWEMLSIIDNDLTIDLTKLTRTLRKKNAPENIINLIKDRFDYYNGLVFTADYEIVRWICHGHMGLSFIWAAFKRSVYEVSKADGCEDPKNEVNRALEARDEIRFNTCAIKWIERSLGNECTFPSEILRMLSLIN
jgi:hypothetical protein